MSLGNARYSAIVLLLRRIMKNRKLLVILLIPVALIITIFGIRSFSSDTNSEGLALKFIDRIATGDASGAFAMLSEEAKLTTNEEQWTGFVNSHKNSLKDPKKVIYSQADDEGGRVEYGINCGAAGSVYHVTIVTVRQDGSSDRIDSVRIVQTSL